MMILRSMTVLWGLLLCMTVTAAQNSSGQTRPQRPDFSGSWEKDYRRSDSWENELNRQIEQLVRAQNRSAQQSAGVRFGGGGPGGQPSRMFDLARLAELISRQNVLEISQNAEEVRIERQGDAALICGTRLNVMQSFASPQGNEICGWENQQLIFRITLPEAVDILHRFSVSADGGWLNMLTTISHGRSSFNLIQVFRRFDMPAGGEFNCRQTLSRGRVCSARGAADE